VKKLEKADEKTLPTSWCKIVSFLGEEIPDSRAADEVVGFLMRNANAP
jgi:hypothetical protein